MGLFDGKNFSVMDSYGMNTLAFVINTTHQDGEESCSIEKLKCLMEQAENGYKKTFYFSEDVLENEKKDLVFLTLKPGEAVLNAGEYVNGKLNVGKKPDSIKYTSLRTTGDSVEYREFKYARNFKRPISIVDPEIGDEVKPVVYFDTEANDLRAKVQLMPCKLYIALEVINE